MHIVNIPTISDIASKITNSSAVKAVVTTGKAVKVTTEVAIVVLVPLVLVGIASRILTRVHNR